MEIVFAFLGVCAALIALLVAYLVVFRGFRPQKSSRSRSINRTRVGSSGSGSSGGGTSP